MKQGTTKRPSPPIAGVQRTYRHELALCLVFLAIAFAYSSSLKGAWAMDDVLALRHVSIGSIRDIVGFREIAYLSFLLNQKIASFSPVSFRVVNILIHFINAALVYILTYLTVTDFLAREMPGREGKGGRDSAPRGETAFLAALFAGLVFGLHPLNIDAVSYIIQRMASLAAMFVLLSLLTYRIACRTNRMLPSAGLYGLSIVFLVTGVFAKENAVLGVPLILLYDYVFLSRRNRAAFLRRFLVIIGTTAACLIFFGYTLNFHGQMDILINDLMHPNSPIKPQTWTATDVYWTPLQHILTEFRIVSRYIILFFLPLPQLLVFDWWGFPVSKSLTDPFTTLLSFGLILFLLVFSVRKIKRYPFLCFGILWYMIAISLESFLTPGLDLYFEHRNYLPLTGLIAGLSGQLAISLGKRTGSRAVKVGAGVLCAALALCTFSRNFVWKNSLTLWSDTYQKCPNNQRAMMALGNAYLKKSDMEKAERYYREVIDRNIHNPRSSFLNEAVYSLGMLYLFRHDLAKARGLISRLHGSDSPRLKVLRNFYKAADGKVDEAITGYKKVIPVLKDYDKVTVYTLLGDALRTKESWKAAIDAYGEAISLDSSFPAAYYGIGDSYLGMGDLPRAEENLSKALSIDPNQTLALSDMADLILIKRESPEKALPFATRAVSNQPPFYQPYVTMANVLNALGREGKAEDYYGQAVKRGMAKYMVPFNKAKISYLRGDKKKFRFYLEEVSKYKIPGELRRIVEDNLRKKERTD